MLMATEDIDLYVKSIQWSMQAFHEFLTFLLASFSVSFLFLLSPCLESLVGLENIKVDTLWHPLMFEFLAKAFQVDFKN